MFPPNNQPPQDENDLNALVANLVQQELQKAQQQPQAGQQPAAQQPAVSPQAQPIQVPINGQLYTFNSPEEVGRAFQEFAQTAQAQVAQAQLAAQAPQAGQEVTGADKPQFDLKTFVDQFTSDPPAAIEGLIKAKTGLSLDDLKRVAEEQTATQRTLAAYQFKDNHPEYMGNPANAARLQQIMDAAGLPFTPEGLEAAYSVGVMRGLIQIDPTLLPQQQQFQQQPNPFMQQQPAQFQQPQVPQGNQFQAPPQFQTPQFSQPQFQGQVDPRNFNGGVNLWQNQFQSGPPRIPRAGAQVNPDLGLMAEDMTPDQIANVFSQLQGG